MGLTLPLQIYSFQPCSCSFGVLEVATDTQTHTHIYPIYCTRSELVKALVQIKGGNPDLLGSIAAVLRNPNSLLGMVYVRGLCKLHG